MSNFQFSSFLGYIPLNGLTFNVVGLRYNVEYMGQNMASIQEKEGKKRLSLQG